MKCPAWTDKSPVSRFAFSHWNGWSLSLACQHRSLSTWNVFLKAKFCHDYYSNSTYGWSTNITAMNPVINMNKLSDYFAYGTICVFEQCLNWSSGGGGGYYFVYSTFVSPLLYSNSALNITNTNWFTRLVQETDTLARSLNAGKL